MTSGGAATVTSTSAVTYDTLGRVKSVGRGVEGVADAWVVEKYTHDDADNKITVTDSQGVLTTFAYDNLNAPTRQTRGAGAVTVQQTTRYNEFGQVDWQDTPTNRANASKTSRFRCFCIPDSGFGQEHISDPHDRLESEAIFKAI